MQSPSGASEKIFAPHFRQTLITLAIRDEFESLAVAARPLQHEFTPI